MATAQETITKFELYMDDTTELSSTEELSLYNKVYQKISTARPWEGTKKAYSGTTDSNDYLALATDFAFLTANNNYTDQSYESSRPVIFVGSTFDKYEVVSWSDRRAYRNKNYFAYLDMANDRLYFTVSPGSGKAVEYDYHSVPADLAAGDSPWFPVRFHDAIYHGMCVDDFIIQQSEKARSYKSEHQQMLDGYTEDMAYWNSQLVQM